MTIHIPRPVALTLGAAAALLTVWMVYKEGPPMYRYVFKFEAM